MSDLDVIQEIEGLIGKKLPLCSTDNALWQTSQSYLLNGQQQVTGLRLSGCTLTKIDFLVALPNLAFLDLGNNQISDLGALKALPNLAYLDLHDNQISDLGALKALPNLTHLVLEGNQISDLGALKALPNLARLYLGRNQISDLGALKALPNLVELYLNNNQISDLGTLKALPNLAHLYLGDNQISDLGALKALPNLTHLGLNGNQISDLGALKALSNLAYLDLCDNKINELPEWLLNLNIPIKLEYNYESGIYLKDNPLDRPPIEIIKQGNGAIRAYFEQIKKEGFDTIYEAKLILVGEPGAGKTSLANKIKNPDWQLIPETKSESTQGIDILSYQFPYNDKAFQVNIWDFGGQEIYHQTHQFFLSKRALYFLLTDNRKEDTDFYHWLNIVDLLSANSPTLIIKNEKSNRSRSIPELQLKAEFANIKGIFATDLNDNTGLAEIIKALHYYITELPHIGTPLPKTWVRVRQQLEQDNRYHIELKDYYALCQDNGFEKESDKLQLSEYLHDLGVCLHFQSDKLLRNTLILKPSWATDAVYKVLDNDKVKKQAGHFNDNDLADIWQDGQYRTMRNELLALMQKFKLCYEIRNQPQHYIAPQLLEENPPDYTWETENNLLLRYRYDFMPKGIISQFIVEMHEYIANNYQSVWKSGVILEKENTLAEIIEYYGKREIHIRVQGNNKKELLNIVGYELDNINRSYERLKDKCKKLIPCSCEKCSDTAEPHFYSFHDLNNFRQNGTKDIQCLRSGKMVNVLGLIDDTAPTGFINLDVLNGETRIEYNNCTINQTKGETTVNNNGHNITAGQNAQVQQFNGSSNNTATQSQNKPAEILEESLFKKPLFYLGVAGFIYFMAVGWGAYDLQNKGLLGNKTFKEIVLAPFSLLKTDEKKP